MRKYGLDQFGRLLESAYPISALDVPALFDPIQCDAMRKRCEESHFVHLFNATWRRAGIPTYLGPPKGSFIDYLLDRFEVETPTVRMELSDLRRWTAYLTLHEEFQAGLTAYRQSNEALRARLKELEERGPMVRLHGGVRRTMRRLIGPPAG